MQHRVSLAEHTQRRTRNRHLVRGFAALLACTALSGTALAQEEPQASTEPDQTIVVTGSLGALPINDVSSIFGFDKTLVETPRSASTVSREQIERFGVTEIYDLVSQS
ncbi:MAG: hypothetical protein NTX28_05670, partial [Novosphingobium sp.]|nr:hypothetical protein [Novosphingobium sp.]